MGLEREGGAGEVVRGHALEDDGCPLFEGDGVGQFDQQRLGNHSIFGIGAARHCIGNALADAKSDAAADGGDGAGSLAAEANRGFGSFVEAGSKIGIDEVDTDGRDLDERFAIAGLRCGEIDVLEIFGTTDGIGNDSLHM